MAVTRITPKYINTTLPRFIAFSLLMLTASFSFAQSKVDRLMELSGIQHQLASIGPMMASGLSPESTGMSDAALKKSGDVLASAFREDKLADHVRGELKSSLSDSETEIMLEWYKSDKASNITEAENNATLVQPQVLMGEVQKLQDRTKLLSLASEVAELSNAADMMMEFQKRIALSVYAAVSAKQNPDEPMDFDAVEPVIDAQLQAVSGQMDQMVVAYMVYAWKDIPEADLEEYVAVLRTEAGRAFTQTSTSSMLNAMNLAFSDAMHSLADIWSEE
jgi:hypothetical protein